MMDARSTCSVAHSFQHPADLSMGSESFFGALPTEVGLLTSLSKYRDYGVIDKSHVERAYILSTDEPFCASTLFLQFPSLLAAYLEAVISSPTLPTEVGLLTNLSTSNTWHLSLDMD